MPRYRNFCFTLNNPADHNGDALLAILADVCSYYVIGQEVGASGTPHWQGYAELKKQTSTSVVHSWSAWHCEARRAPKASDAANYCKKDGNILIEAGVMSAPGKRTDIDDLHHIAIKEGMGAVSDAATSMQQFRLIETWMHYHGPKRNPDIDPEVIYIWGPSGAGKSRAAFELASIGRYYIKDEGPWWTGYDGESTVVMDDFRDSWMKLTEFIKLVDRYPMQVKVHGNLTQLRATRWILTSVHPPESLYQGTAGEPRAQVARRITKIIHIAGPISSADAIENDPELDEYGVSRCAASAVGNRCAAAAVVDNPGLTRVASQLSSTAADCVASPAAPPLVVAGSERMALARVNRCAIDPAILCQYDRSADNVASDDINIIPDRYYDSTENGVGGVIDASDCEFFESD